MRRNLTQPALLRHPRMVSGMLAVCSVKDGPGLYRLRGTTPPPPCFEHQYQNKGLSSPKSVMNIKTKHLARSDPFIQNKAFVFMFLRAPRIIMDFCVRQAGEIRELTLVK
jgi:hypothetical protein